MGPGIEILIVAVIGALFSTGTLLYWQRTSVDKTLLSSFILVLSFLVLSMSVVGAFAGIDHPLINLTSLLFYVLLLVIAPCMYLYLDYYLNEESLEMTLGRNANYFALPAGLFVINLCAFVVIYSSAEDSLYTQISAKVITYANFIALVFAFLLQNIYFIHRGIKRYRNYKQELGEVFSTTDDVNTQRWIKLFLGGYILFIVMIYLRQSFGTGDLSFAILFVSYIGFVSYNGFRRPSYSATWEVVSQHAVGIASGNIGCKPNEATGASAKLKEKGTDQQENKIGISDTLQEEIWARVEFLIQENKVYLDTSITLYSLAKMASTNTKYLRYIIKERSGKNFSSYINSFRIEEAKQRLLSEESTLYTMDSIGKMSGFKSKSAFYLTFKEFTGNTPKQYQNSN